MSALLQDFRELKTDPRTLRKFGWLVGGVLCALGLWLLFRGRAAHPWFWAMGGALVLLGTILPRALKRVYLAWMALALLLGFIVSHVVLTLFFYLVITPVGLIARLLARKDFLRLRLDRQAASYWLPRPRDKARPPADFERQF